MLITVSGLSHQRQQLSWMPSYFIIPHPILPNISAKHFSNPFFFNAIATAWVKFLSQLGITIIPYGTLLPSLPSGSTFLSKLTLNILVHKFFNENKGENHAVLSHHLQDKMQIIPRKWYTRPSIIWQQSLLPLHTPALLKIMLSPKHTTYSAYAVPLYSSFIILITSLERSLNSSTLS